MKTAPPSYQPLRTLERILLLSCAGVYLAIAASGIEQPGLEYDETIFINPALGDVDGTFVEWSLRSSGAAFP